MKTQELDKKEIKELEEKIEEIKKLNEKISELERQIDKCDSCERIGLNRSELMTYRNQVKSEAYQEFAEILKESADSHFDYSELIFEISEENLDNLVNEMKEKLKK